ncbi:M28 family peptidase [Microbacterium sp. ASV49]|uniref:M28 family peptidase n=1 Tax=Microbacterium candidum TaxID=3041922 RepID=A0ABT7MYJ4_9MICO|nr:M28 family peptidase [Microbacterium sp. ASV49]MDL9979522.1 M28 family peptidase [Microbacterium sp. ASV49]
MHVTESSIMASIEDLVAMSPRATGSAGGESAAAYVERRFAEAGLDTQVLEVPSFSWTAECSLQIGDDDIPCAPVLHSGLAAHDWTGTADHQLDAPVVDIGTDRVRRHDVRGAIVLFDLTFDMTVAHSLPLTLYLHDPGRRVFRREVLASRNPYVTSLARTMTEAAAGGAVGVIGVLRDYPDSRNYHNEYYRRTLFPLPGVSVTRAEGLRLRGLLQHTPRARLRLDIARREVVSRSVIGVLPGRTADTIMIQSHHDSIGPGAVEDASGTAEVIALAEHFGAQAAAGRIREKTLLFVTFDTHFTGYQAHREFARRYVLARRTPWNIVLNATIEHIGLRAVEGPDGGFASTGETEPRGVFVNVNPAFTVRIGRAVRRHGLHGTSLLGAGLLEFFAGGIPTDASFTFVSGVPTISLISGPLYLYDDADTIDRIDRAQLLPVARFFADIVDDADGRRGTLLGTMPARLRRLLPRGRW